MSDAIAATFSDFKLIRGRKVAQLVLEIPIEKAQEALSTLGMPIPGTELWCAVARLKDEPKAKASVKFTDKPLSQQAGIRCHDTAFQKFIGAAGEEEAALFVRNRCGIKSRADLDVLSKTTSRLAWRALDSEFLDWLGTQRAQQQHDAYVRT